MCRCVTPLEPHSRSFRIQSRQTRGAHPRPPGPQRLLDKLPSRARARASLAVPVVQPLHSAITRREQQRAKRQAHLPPPAAALDRPSRSPPHSPSLLPRRRWLGASLLAPSPLLALTRRRLHSARVATSSQCTRRKDDFHRGGPPPPPPAVLCSNAAMISAFRALCAARLASFFLRFSSIIFITSV